MIGSDTLFGYISSSRVVRCLVGKKYAHYLLYNYVGCDIGFMSAIFFMTSAPLKYFTGSLISPSLPSFAKSALAIGSASPFLLPAPMDEMEIPTHSLHASHSHDLRDSQETCDSYDTLSHDTSSCTPLVPAQSASTIRMWSIPRVQENISATLVLPPVIMSSNAPIFRVALTGGPCSGKTSSLVVLQDWFANRGWTVYVVPEAATLLFGGGVYYPDLNEEARYALEVQIMRMKFYLEDAFYKIALAAGKKTLLICDRGTMDSLAYASESNWKKMLGEHNWTTVGLRDSRYDCVIHLQTAANGAESFYTTANNTVRLESPAEAIKLDDKVKECWIGHPYLFMIDNATAFQPKIMRVVEAVSKFIGEEASGIIKRKYLIAEWPKQFPVTFRDSKVEYHYIITTDGSQARLRKRGDYGGVGSTYTLTIRAPINAERVQRRRNIPQREYNVYHFCFFVFNADSLSFKGS